MAIDLINLNKRRNKSLSNLYWALWARS